MTTNGNEKVAKSCTTFHCEICNYSTVRKSSIDKHYSTSKHLKSMNGNEKVAKSCVTCNNCDKQFNDRSGLWRHKKKCNTVSTDSSNNDFVFDKEFVMSILKHNSELQTQMMEVIKNGTHNTTNTNTNTNTNSHNKTFNLQFFLNETCKDAMNITDFVNSIQLQLTDLMNMGEVGYVNGMSNIIIKNLNDLEVHERPVHCTDVKREVLYVKDEDKWNKETEGNPKIRGAVKRIAQKNSKQLFEFKDKYPDCVKSHSKHSDTYNNLLIESMGGKGDNEIEKENKIIKKVAKEIVVASIKVI